MFTSAWAAVRHVHCVCVCVRVSAAYASDYDIIESCAGHVIFIELI